MGKRENVQKLFSVEIKNSNDDFRWENPFFLSMLTMNSKWMREPFERSFNKNDFSVSHIFCEKKRTFEQLIAPLKCPSSLHFIQKFHKFLWEKKAKLFFQVQKHRVRDREKKYYFYLESREYLGNMWVDLGFSRRKSYVNEISYDTRHENETTFLWFFSVM